MLILYDIIYFFFVLTAIPILIFKGKWRRELLSRFGFFPSEFMAKCQTSKVIWLHAVSVGEILAAENLIQKMSGALPGYHLVLTTVTNTGFDLARQRFVPMGIAVIYAPLDFRFVVKKYINAIGPKMYITAETEIWPNLFRALQKQQVPIVQVNGRISEAAFQKYQRVKFLFKNVLKAVSVFCMQSSFDADRIKTLGAVADKIRIVGNMKFDQLVPEKIVHRSDFGYSDQELIWVAGSTHPGEERIVLNIYRHLKSEFSNLRLILAPRHVERVDEISRLLSTFVLPNVRYSQWFDRGIGGSDVLLVDTIGELRSLYQIADLVFVGKSIIGKGGQNVIEPAAYGKPVLVGPHVENFRQIVQIFLDAEAMVQVKDEEGLLEQMGFWLRNLESARAVGQRARDVVLSNQGATQRTLEEIKHLLN